MRSKGWEAQTRDVAREAKTPACNQVSNVHERPGEASMLVTGLHSCRARAVKPQARACARGAGDKSNEDERHKCHLNQVVNLLRE